MLSIVILAHNQASLTRQCLDALTHADGDLEVVLADNASTDDTGDVAGEYERRLPRLHYHRFSRNLSYAVANNLAVRHTAGDTLLFLNNDVVASPNALMRLSAAVEASGGGIAGAQLVYPGTATIQHAGIRQMLWGYVSNLGTGARAAEPALNRGGDIFAVTGAMMAVGRSLFERIGGFDERYRWGYEDVDLCMTARAAGATVHYVPEASSVHVESATLAGVRQPVDLGWNYGLYRRRWNHVLVPNERAAIARLRQRGVRRVVVFGTGLAAAGLHRTLTRYEIDVAAFTATIVDRRTYCTRPVLPLEEIGRRRFDRLIVATQHYFALRDHLSQFDPSGAAIFPLADGEVSGCG